MSQPLAVEYQLLAGSRVGSPPCLRAVLLGDGFGGDGLGPSILLIQGFSENHREGAGVIVSPWSLSLRTREQTHYNSLEEQSILQCLSRQ